MHWTDEGYLISKRNYDENSIIIEAFTLDHGKCAGIIYGGSSRKKKRFFQIGNKIFLNEINMHIDNLYLSSAANPAGVPSGLDM